MGRLEESKDELERARRLDPLSLSINSTTGLPLYLEGQYDRAAEQMLKTVELDPNFYLAHVSLGCSTKLEESSKERLLNTVEPDCWMTVRKLWPTSPALIK
jgi:tetratricopeptide (TPR) repeat protein